MILNFHIVRTIHLIPRLTYAYGFQLMKLKTFEKNLTHCLIRTAALLLLELDSQERISSNVNAKNAVSEL